MRVGVHDALVTVPVGVLGRLDFRGPGSDPGVIVLVVTVVVTMSVDV